MSKRNRKKDVKPERKKPFSISDIDMYPVSEQPVYEFKPYAPPASVIPEAKRADALANDATPYETLNAFGSDCLYGGFQGYPMLAMKAQQSEYANVAAIFADEVTRNWLTVKSSSDDEDLVNEVEGVIVKYRLQDMIHQAVLHDCLFGIAHIYIDMGADENEMRNPLFKDRAKVGDKFRGFRIIEPIWTYPAMYNTLRPWEPDFYQPSSWFVMGQTIHASRFIDLVTRPVSQILKPAYNFGGLSLIQLMEPYVKAWETIRDEIPKIVKAFTLTGLKTDMEKRMENPGEFKRRIDIMTNYRNNRGVLALDTEEAFFQINTPMTDLEKIASNYQEQLCIPSRMPVIKLLGNAPAGLNANGQGEIDVWHETISGIQERNIRPMIQQMLDYLFIAEFGQLLPEITFTFNPLDELTEKEMSEINLNNASMLANLATSSCISTMDVAQWLINNPKSGFAFMNGQENEDETEEKEGENT
ncbi:DUF1073 domain-containing protein [Candidatus Arsenophonus triatominarum]|uniref:phage portal protein n=1 Tax=Candidatus Arsenophonus triatominarum TaxID=57911 RepID=UPI0007C456BA|nr:DUF1073 domain-containing protein [Candidatus Arsenophonus triatominarum]